MNTRKYEQAGVKHLGKAKPAESIVAALRHTFANRKGKVGEVLLDFGPYANVIKIDENTGIAVKTDGVGTKVLIAELMNKYDTIGIDCVAMNVNDLICIGAEPLTMLDYIAVEKADPAVFAAVSKGLQEGARQANITIPGGEVAQIKDMIKGIRPDSGIDLVGASVGIIHPKEIITGNETKAGDVLIGFRSSGLHSNGYTLARKVLLDEGGFTIEQEIPELGKRLGEELLTPTKIYVPDFIALRDAGIRLKALFHFTGGGLLNLQRVAAPVGFRIHYWPQPQPIFSLIQKTGNLSDEEMFSTFNMGIGFGVVVPREDQEKVLAIAQRLKSDAFVLGECVNDPAKIIIHEPTGLVGEQEKLLKATDETMQGNGANKQAGIETVAPRNLESIRLK